MDPVDKAKLIGVVAVWSAFAGLARTALRPRRWESGWDAVWAYLRGVLLAAFVGVATHLAIEDLALSPGMRSAIVGAMAFSAEEVLLYVLGFIGGLPPPEELAKLLFRHPARFWSVLREIHGEIRERERRRAAGVPEKGDD